MEIEEGRLKGVRIFRPKIFRDSRGLFFELFREGRLEHAVSGFVQDNCSISRQNTIRGMHFQRRPGQAKLVTVILGKVFDVVVDMRRDSPTFGQWEGFELSDTDYEQILIPVGFAHGFCVLSERACLLYKVSSPYDAEEEKGFCFNDREVGIQWPVDRPILSERDRTAPSFREVVA